MTRDLVMADPGVARCFGIAPEEGEHGVPLSKFLARVHPDDSAFLWSAIKRTVEEKGHFWAIYRLAGTEGREGRVLNRGKVHAPEGGRQRFSGVVLKIGEDYPPEPELASHVPPEGDLGPRELQCLEWCSRGKTNWEIAQILGIAERTVEHHIASAIRKLSATTRTHAVAEALRNGLIS